MSVIAQFSYLDRNPGTPGLDLMPDLPIILRHQSHSVSTVALIDSGAMGNVLPYSLGVQLGFDWNAEKARIVLGGVLMHVNAKGIMVEASIGQLPPVNLLLAWADSDQAPFVLGQFNFFQIFNVCFFRAQGMFEITQSSPTGPP